MTGLIFWYRRPGRPWKSFRARDREEAKLVVAILSSELDEMLEWREEPPEEN